MNSLDWVFFGFQENEEVLSQRFPHSSEDFGEFHLFKASLPRNLFEFHGTFSAPFLQICRAIKSTLYSVSHLFKASLPLNLSPKAEEEGGDGLHRAVAHLQHSSKHLR